MTDSPTRRTILGAAAALTTAGFGLAGRAVAQPVSGTDVVPLWPGEAPGRPSPAPVRKTEDRSKDQAHPDRAVMGIDRPTLIVRRPAAPTGAAGLLIPGGGYSILSYDNEGEEQARWLTALGVTVFILLHRLPGEGWANRQVVPLQDAQRAMRVIRRDAATYGVDPARIAVIGFSAGGHLAGSLATRHAERVHESVDAADTLSARPDLAGLIYPVVSMSAPFTHGGSRDKLLGPSATPEARKAASVELRVDAGTSPIFLAHASDDGVVPIANSLTLYAALLAAKRPAELHAFDEGGHGFGVRLPKAIPASQWPALFTAYARRRGVFSA